MSGFDDDFGEMVGGKEETGDLTEDPAAEFLAREQEQLGELETELGPLSGWFHTLRTVNCGNIAPSEQILTRSDFDKDFNKSIKLTSLLMSMIAFY